MWRTPECCQRQGVAGHGLGLPCLSVGQRVTQLASSVRVFGLRRDLGDLEPEASELIAGASGQPQIGSDIATCGIGDGVGVVESRRGQKDGRRWRSNSQW